jgi:hypothetical protein
MRTSFEGHGPQSEVANKHAHETDECANKPEGNSDGYICGD